MKKVMKKHICIALVAVLFTGLCLGAAILTGNAAPTGAVFKETFENASNCTMLNEFWGTENVVSISAAQKHSGNSSLFFDVSGIAEQANTRSPYIPAAELKKIVTAPGEYKLEAYVFFENSPSAVGAVFAFSGNKPSNCGWTTTAKSVDEFSTKAGQWNRLLFTFDVSNELYSAISSGSFDIRLRFDKMGDVSAYYDDVTFASSADMPTPTPTPTETATPTPTPTATPTPEVNEYDGLYVEDFEGAEHAYGSVFWTLGTASVTDEKAYAGNKALKYVYASSDGSDHSQGSPYLDPAMLKKVVTKTGTYKFSLYAYFTGVPDKVTAILRTENKTFADKQWGKSLTIDEVSKNADEWNKLVFTLEVDDEILARVQAPETYGLKLCLDNFCLKSGTTYFDNIVFGLEDKIPAEPTPTPGVTPTPTPDYTGCYFEDLEDGNTAYGNVFWNLGTAIVTNVKAYSGKKSLKYVYAKSIDGADHSQGSPYLDPEMLKKVVTKTGTYNFELYAYFTETPDKLTAILRTENKTFSDKQWGRSLTAVEVGKEANKWNKIVFTLEVDDEILARIQDPETYGLKLCLDNFCLQSGTTYFDDIAFGTPEKIEQARSNSEHSGDYGYFGLAAVIVLAAGAAIIIKKKSERV